MYTESDAPIAVCDDLWLIKLFIVQRRLKKSKCIIDSMSKSEKYNYPNQFLIYYFGYAVTSMEYRYICSMNAEYESEIEMQIYELRNTLMIYDKNLTKKERKSIKNTIKVLEKLNVSKDMEHVKANIDTVIDRPGMVIDYLENLDTFRRCMEE